MTIDWPNHVWAADITYVPIRRGFLSLVVVIDWASRAVLAWRMSNTTDVPLCVSALAEALDRFGRHDIFKTDQGSQFTSAAFTGNADGREARAGIAFYNARRPHHALANRTPLAVCHDGISCMLADTAVDITLRLDNADALTTAATAAESGKIDSGERDPSLQLRNRSQWSH